MDNRTETAANRIRIHDTAVAEAFLRILDANGNGHDYLEFAYCGPYSPSNRNARIARQVWRDQARAYPAGDAPYYENVLRELDARVRAIYSVDPGDVAPTVELIGLSNVNN